MSILEKIPIDEIKLIDFKFWNRSFVNQKYYFVTAGKYPEYMEEAIGYICKHHGSKWALWLSIYDEKGRKTEKVAVTFDAVYKVEKYVKENIKELLAAKDRRFFNYKEWATNCYNNDYDIGSCKVARMIGF